MELITKDAAVKMISDGAHVSTTGFIGSGHPQTISSAIEEHFLKTGHPRDLTYQFSAGVGDNDHRGNNYYGHAGLLKRVIGAHYATAPRLGKLISANEVEAYNLPQGVVTHLFRAAAGKKPGILTKVGLKTFIDPRVEGGKLNTSTTEDIVEVKKIDGEEYLFYKTFPTDVALIRASTADEHGNLTMEREAVITEAFSIAAAAKAAGGIVIAEVERLAAAGSMAPKNIIVPGSLVDYVVIGDKDKFMQTNDEYFNPSYTGEVKVPLNRIPPLPLNERKVIARRAAMELDTHCRTNLGIGMPEGVASVAAEEGFGDTLLMTVESGGFGGLPAAGGSFGATLNAESTICHSSMFDFYDGGNLDVTCLGIAEVDSAGNLNVSKFGPKIAGCGGFINISQNTPKIIFCGTLTAGGLRVKVENNELHILQEGRKKKFVPQVEQITFSAEYAKENGQKVLYITERAVFELGKEGLVLTEIAPGVDLQKDVLDQINAKVKVSQKLKTMDTRIFQEGPMGLASEIVKGKIKGVA
ncbi:acyl CoA:acetate/3-ketoacid CoA transferase [Pectinatus brassicae]|uniref:Propionate CoA-transferase n=1 Tax=Pectinatus brassicae TaxID=862415 RepID=A0A840UX73_9FIRM|nr:CoA-transferase [Pectinatus brassicae]MBB5336995.1 propionate CoA-transferase [Pectinatus brassicae]